jgi:hypothetical protein
MQLIIKGSINRPTATEYGTLLQYHFSVSPIGQTLDGRDRVFTLSLYTSHADRDTVKHSKERKLIAKRLRERHTRLWQHFHNEMHK